MLEAEADPEARPSFADILPEVERMRERLWSGDASSSSEGAGAVLPVEKEEKKNDPRIDMQQQLENERR